MSACKECGVFRCEVLRREKAEMMKRGEALKQFMTGMKDLNVMIEIDNDMNVIPAEAAIRIRERLNELIPEVKKEVQPKQAPKASKGKKLDTPKMVALRKAGWTYDKIADEMGCSTQTVINHIKKVSS